MKKKLLATLIMVNSSLFAGSMGPVCDSENVTISCKTTDWAFDVHALYLQSLFSGSKSYNATLFENGSSPLTEYNNYPMDWNWGFKLEGAYYFQTGNDVNLNWSHLVGQNKSYQLPNTARLFDVQSGKGTKILTTKTDWDAINLEVGQRVDLGTVKNIRLHGGGQYAFIKNRSNLSLLLVYPGSTLQTLIENPSFSGFGPRIGVDLSFEVAKKIDIYAKGATTLLVGSSKIKRNRFNQVISGFVYNPITSASKTALVPELEGTLGIHYTVPMAESQLTFDLNYIWINYFSALPQFNDDSNFGLQGPSFGFVWKGNIL